MLPPSRVQIKRKATDDPVEILRVHDELRTGRSVGQFVFKRQRTVNGPRPDNLKSADPVRFPAGFDSPQRVPQVKVSQPGDELRDPFNRSLGPVPAATPQAGHHNILTSSLAPSVSPSLSSAQNDATLSSRPIAEPRRFHLARSSMRDTMSRVAGVNAGRAVRKQSIAVFHERKTTLPANILERQDVSVAGVSPVIAPQPSLSQAAHSEPPKELNKKTSISLLRLTPVSAVKPRRNSPAPLRNARLASGEIMPWNASAEKLDAEMQAYSLKEISRIITEASQSHPPTPVAPKSVFVAPKSPASRFTPRKGAGVRYHERHPEVPQPTATAETKTESHDGDSMDMDEDESSYIVETYIRVPVEQVNLERSQASIGLLVLDSQPDIDEFYNEDSDSDSDIYDEEEDENAENHPSTEYPDEEVQSDDEYGVNPYQYRNGNASDNEEYDEDDAAFSDDELEASKEPWSRRPWLQAYSGKHDEGSDEEGGLY